MRVCRRLWEILPTVGKFKDSYIWVIFFNFYSEFCQKQHSYAVYRQKSDLNAGFLGKILFVKVKSFSLKKLRLWVNLWEICGYLVVCILSEIFYLWNKF